MSANALQQINLALMQTLNFTSADLAANRQGALTQAQQDRLKVFVAQGMRSGTQVAGMVILIVVVVCVAIALGSQGIIPLPSELEGLGENAPLVLGVMGVILIFYVLMLVYALRKSRAMASGKAKVRALTGKVKVKSQRAYYNNAASRALVQAANVPSMTYIVQVGRAKIYSTDPAVEQAFADGIIYRVYVIGSRASYLMVSAEAISGR
ncbi:MAG TPA: hypothetical protein VHD90_01375 [Phototrophicaceae bacterium]|nr:hypothetical protein [Phototrophicaceae bacterium]